MTTSPTSAAMIHAWAPQRSAIIHRPAMKIVAMAAGPSRPASLNGPIHVRASSADARLAEPAERGHFGSERGEQGHGTKDVGEDESRVQSHSLRPPPEQSPGWSA